MAPNLPSTSEVISIAESYQGIRAGIARLGDLLESPSYRDTPVDDTTVRDRECADRRTRWPARARSVLVLGLYHPAKDPRMDYWERGNTRGNRRLQEIAAEIQHELSWVYRISTHPLPYQAKRGGVFLKDAAALSGIGIIGRNNLLIHPQWGPCIRLRALLIEECFEPTGACTDFAPCENCDEFCRKACPREAFSRGRYNRSACNKQMYADLANRLPLGKVLSDGRREGVTSHCRACELACPVAHAGTV